jgi:hypothetical protein
MFPAGRVSRVSRRGPTVDVSAPGVGLVVVIGSRGGITGVFSRGKVGVLSGTPSDRSGSRTDTPDKGEAVSVFRLPGLLVHERGVLSDSPGRTTGSTWAGGIGALRVKLFGPPPSLRVKLFGPVPSENDPVGSPGRALVNWASFIPWPLETTGWSFQAALLCATGIGWPYGWSVRPEPLPQCWQPARAIPARQRPAAPMIAFFPIMDSLPPDRVWTLCSFSPLSLPSLPPTGGEGIGSFLAPVGGILVVAKPTW